MTGDVTPRVLLIAQWPGIKNAEYELAERIRRTGYKVTVVDFFGMDVHAGKSINTADLSDEYDFALSFHYETPKFLNIPTFLWVANPLEFLHGSGSYRTHVLHQVRSYDDYVYNGSDLLKEHTASVVGGSWVDSGLSFFQSCSRKALIAPRAPAALAEPDRRLFYCGVNWEALSDKQGRAQGLLEQLQARQLADFYGPRTLLGMDVWAPFPSYRGEIPFDGTSMFPAMHEYRAVLAVSSPAHLKSRTSSGRVLEGFAAGVPVISDDNAHVRRQFGDLVYYYSGESEAEQADSVEAALEEIQSHPERAVERVRAAQERMSREYCFEPCFERARAVVQERRAQPAPARRRLAVTEAKHVVVDVFLFEHDPYSPDPDVRVAFNNLPHLMRAMAAFPANDRVRYRLLHQGMAAAQKGAGLIPASECIDLGIDEGVWRRLRLGEKVERLAARSTGDYAVFLTQSDFPQYDFFTKALDWFAATGDDSPALHVAGFYANDLADPAPFSAGAIVRSNASESLYRWTQDSIAQHQLGQFCWNRAALALMDLKRLRRFDVLFAVAAVLECKRQAVRTERSRHILVRVNHSYFHRYHNAFCRVAGQGLWAQSYALLSNASHEISGLFDAFHENRELVAIADRILGVDLPPPPPAPSPAPPALEPHMQHSVLQVAHFLNRISPYVVRIKKIGGWFGLR